MSPMKRFPGVLYGAGFALMVVYVFPEFFGLQLAQDSLLLIFGLLLSAGGGIIEMLGNTKVQESAENA
ncbi:hypothetical protein [Parerythrobacter aestuarii]|uniref:hypothetical protein n=1 Tax=Parerythrobacter aestuarii TaxID=3020909 RepID=UPI0024DE3655|nr:hypothetical protein [Parerythrobacter aestuarii]